MSQRSAVKRLVYSAVLAVLLVAAVELLCLGAWRLAEGRGFSYAEVFARRAAVAATAGAAAEEAAAAPVPIPGLDDLASMANHFQGQVIHPFLGYVYTPEYNDLAWRADRPIRVADDGFFELRAPRVQPSEDPLRVAVFGGSVAFVFSLRSAAFADRLVATVPGLAARGVEVKSQGLGGWKQPQQLMALAWLLAQGDRPDVVVNLDGFNEVALPATENLPRGTYPFFPRGWEMRTRQAEDAGRQALVGEVVFLRRQRSESATAFSRPVLRWSVAWNFLWSWLDHRAEAAEVAAQERLAAYRPKKSPYVATGPGWHNPGGEAMYDELVAFWERSSLTMKSLCDGAGVPYLHFLQPNQYLEGSKVLSAEERRTAFREDQPYRPAVIAGYPRLRAAGERLTAQGVDFHDLTQIFATVDETVYIDQCCHLNERGNQIMGWVIASAVAEELASRGGVPAAP